MEIYIEDALLQNFLLLFFSLSVAKQISKECKHIWLQMLSCLLGSVFIVFFAVLRLNTIMSFLTNLIIIIFVSLLSLGKDKPKNFALYILSFEFSRYLYIGIGSMISKLFQWKMSGNVLVGLIFVCFAISKKLIKQFYKKQKLNNFYYNLKLCVLGKDYNITAYLDSGNLLQDDDTGLSILVLDLDTFLRIFADKISIVDILQKRLDKKINGKYITCQTTHGNGKMFVCEIDGIFSKESKSSDKKLHALVGFGNFGFEKKDCQGLLSPLAL